MLTLYHMPIAICAQKARVCLAEKGVPWDAQDVSSHLRSPEYLKLNPAGYVPTLVHDGKVITESRVISEYIDETFQGPALQPSTPYERSVMRRWTKQIDETFHPYIFILTFVALARERVLQMSPEEQKKDLPLDPVKAGRMLEMIERGWDSQYLVIALKRFEKLTADMESALRTSKWLAGEEYSLADADYTPYLQRMEDLGLAWLWQDKPALASWYERVRERKSFATVVMDWISPEGRQAAAANAREIGPKFQRVLDSSRGI